ncbi:MAG: hypothetical protein OEV64_00930 [Desulfobulbaceae bacterium]|nr:hypothetical protein [Desulfobulbaceae bacterium]
MKKYFIILNILWFSGCAPVPNGGYYGDISRLGSVGMVLDTVRVGKGLLVETAHLDKNRTVNLQINEEEVPQTEPHLYSRTLTIGKFSKIWGSGFSGPKNIYYRKRIWYNGRDVFDIEGNRYLVEWQCDYRDPITYLLDDMYTVTFRSLGK